MVIEELLYNFVEDKEILSHLFKSGLYKSFFRVSRQAG